MLQEVSHVQSDSNNRGILTEFGTSSWSRVSTDSYRRVAKRDRCYETLSTPLEGLLVSGVENDAVTVTVAAELGGVAK